MMRLGWDPSMDSNAPWNRSDDQEELREKYEDEMVADHKEEAIQYIVNQILDLWVDHPRYKCPAHIGACGMDGPPLEAINHVLNLVTAALDGLNNQIISSIVISCGLGSDFDEWCDFRAQRLLERD